MPSKIRVLDDHTINQIAAGEVIENPSSVVKELVENSLDASSREIIIEIKGGGRQLIRVTDDGEGMNGDDALLCFERHATSKIKGIDDIFSVATMGFRGEAIPSIASISKLSLITATENGKGTIVQIEGGKIRHTASAQRNKGTTFEVKDLFFNLPVRKKFLRSPDFDTQEILKTVSAIALAHPEIKFTLISNEKELIKVREEPMKERIKGILGGEFSCGLSPLNLEKEAISLSGFIGLPSFTRHNRTGQHLFINNRPVFSPMISHAVKEGYGTALAASRHPVFILHLNIPGSNVDVNVHPQKREVRLRNSTTLYDAIKEAVQESLGGTTTREPEFIFHAPPIFRIPETPFKFVQPETRVLKEEAVALFEIPKPKFQIALTIPDFILIFSESGRLQVIDQRAAHARILFEELEKGEITRPQTQQLLIPLVIEMAADESQVVKSQINKLKKWGISIEEFGPKSFRIDAIPKLWDNEGLKTLIHEIAEGAKDFVAEIDKKLALTAASKALSSKKKLSIEEANYLLHQLYACKQPHFCPMGKKTIADIDLYEYF